MKKSDFQFLGYKITNITYEANTSFGQAEEKLEHSVNIENNFDSEQPRAVEVVLNITVKAESGNMSFYLQLRGAFLGNDAMSQKIFETFAKQNGPAILYPFARSLIVSYTSQANIQPIMLPVMNFVMDKPT